MVAQGANFSQCVAGWQYFHAEDVLSAGPITVKVELFHVLFPAIDYRNTFTNFMSTSLHVEHECLHVFKSHS